MTTQEQINNIREACLKSNQSILDLVMGCEWKHNEDGWVYVDGFSISTTQKGGWTSIPPDEEEIIGRKIGLADVLLAIEQTENKSYQVDCFGHFLSYNVAFNVWQGEAKNRWNLKQDDLTKQSPETIEFINNLLNI